MDKRLSRNRLAPKQANDTWQEKPGRKETDQDSDVKRTLPIRGRWIPAP